MERPRRSPDSLRKKRPDDVQRSVFGDNQAHLRNAGRKGALAANRAKEEARAREEVRRDVQHAVDAEYAEKDAERLKEALEATNEHLLDPDGCSPDPDERPEAR